MSGEQPIQLEKLFRVMEGRRRFTLGIPAPSTTHFSLAVLTPEGASMLVSQGIEVVIERGMGRSIHYADNRYSKAGASIGSRAETLACDVVLYWGWLEPQEISAMKPHSVLLTMDTRQRLPQASAMLFMERRINVIALDNVRDRRGLFPLADILDEVSGRACVATATSFLADPNLGKGILLGGIAGVNPCEVVILGTGMAALAAARSVIGLGGMVRLFDNDPYCLRTAISELGPAVIGSSLHPSVLGHALGAADVIIATRLDRHFAIDDTVLDSLKKGAILFDLADRQGISATFPTLKCVNVATALEDGVLPGSNVCFINPVSAVPRSAAMAMTNDIIPIVDRLFGSGHGLINVLKTDAGLRGAVLFFRGRAVSRDLAEALRLRWVDINLLLTFS